MRNVAARDDLAEVLHSLSVRLERMERHSHTHSGRAGVSTDQGNAARVGGDGLVYVNEHVSKLTPPSPTDFATEYIGYGSIWVETT